MDQIAPNEPPAKKPMHGALKFFLFAMAGGLLGMICTPCFVGAAMPKNWSLKEQYELAIYCFIGVALVFAVLTGIAMLLKRRGAAGFFFGVSMLMATALIVTLAMRMFDAPNHPGGL